MLPHNGLTGERGSRLDSWKEIAAYLNRDARTVQRWEKTEGLPVHRHVHESLATVYAYTNELDAWRAERAKRASVEAVTPPMAHPSWFRRFGGIGWVLALALVTSGSHPSALHLKEHDWVMLEAFENRTGEALFEGTLRAALERELSNSEFMSVAPRERVEDALRLMKQPSETVLTAALAREVCLRDGGIRALVTGRTERVGSTYLVSAEVVDPIQNGTLASDTETASGPDEVWPAVRRLSNWVRKTLGETRDRIDGSNRQLEKVTTPSLRALQLFTEADSAARRHEWAVSAQFARQALVEDPEFASARLWLAMALANLHEPGSMLEAKRALDLSDRVSERERYFILGIYEQMMGHVDRAIPPFEALARRYPDHFFVYSNLSSMYRLSGRVEEAARLAAKFADARPNDPTANVQAIWMNENVDMGQARRYAQLAAKLGSLENASLTTQASAILFQAHNLWMQEDAKGALAELQRVTDRVKDSHDPALLRAVTKFQLTLGRFQSSQELIKSFDRDRSTWSAWVSFIKGDEEPARRYAALIPQETQRLTGMAALLAARLWPAGAKKEMPGEGEPWMRGEVALAQGRFVEAAVLLQPTFDKRIRNRLPGANLIADGLASALEQSGDSQKALQVLEAATGTRTWIPTLDHGDGPFWLRNEARLSAYHHRVGRPQEARKIDDRLRKLLAVADADHPILRQLNVTRSP